MTDLLSRGLRRSILVIERLFTNPRKIVSMSLLVNPLSPIGSVQFGSIIPRLRHWSLFSPLNFSVISFAAMSFSLHPPTILHLAHTQFQLLQLRPHANSRKLPEVVVAYLSTLPSVLISRCNSRLHIPNPGSSSLPDIPQFTIYPNVFSSASYRASPSLNCRCRCGARPQLPSPRRGRSGIPLRFAAMSHCTDHELLQGTLRAQTFREAHEVEWPYPAVVSYYSRVLTYDVRSSRTSSDSLSLIRFCMCIRCSVANFE